MSFRNIDRKKILLMLLSLTVFGFYIFRLHYPQNPYYDEIYYVNFIKQLIHDHHYATRLNQHPPLWFLLTSMVMILIGDYSWVWRIISLAAGFGVIFFTYKISEKIFKNSNIAIITAFIIAFDFLSMTQARVGMMNSLMLCLMLAALFFFLRSLDPAEKKVEEGVFQKKYLIISGVFWGMAISTKILAFSLFPVIFIIFFEHVWQFKSKRKESVMWFIISFCVLPVLIFFASHLFIPLLEHRTFADIWKTLKYNLHHHLTTQASHRYGSRWWAWPLLKRPIWFHFDLLGGRSPNHTISGIMCVGNPILFWSIPAAILYTTWDLWKRKSAFSKIILLGFLTQWGQYFFIARLQFFHYFFSAMPFVAMSIALLLSRIWNINKAGKTFVIFYLAAVFLIFLYWYPLLTGYPVSESFYRNHIWFKSWI